MTAHARPSCLTFSFPFAPSKELPTADGDEDDTAQVDGQLPHMHALHHFHERQANIESGSLVTVTEVRT